MTWEETPKDLEAYQAALDAQAASGVDSRIAEGRARSKAVRTWRTANPEEAAKLEKAPKAPAAAAAGGNGAQAQSFRSFTKRRGRRTALPRQQRIACRPRGS